MEIKNKFDGQPGVYLMSNKDYHASEGISNTHLVNMQTTPAHYKAWLLSERKDTESMQIGRVSEVLILEPDKFQNMFAVCPKVDKRTKEGKELWAKLQAESEGREIVPDWMVAQCESIRDSFKRKILSHPAYSRLFDGWKQLSFYWRNGKTGLLCKCRPDVLSKWGMVTDLKITEDASPFEFQRSVVKYGYHMQAAWYVDGVNETLRQTRQTLPDGATLPSSFVLVPGERELPYEIAMYELEPHAIQEGRWRCQEMLELYARCTKTDQWPGYELEIKKLDLPSWAYRSIK